MNWKRTKTLFIFVFVLVNILLVMIYINKVTKSQINESESDNDVNFQQEEIKISKDVLNKDVSDTKMQMITATSKNFDNYAEDKSSLEADDSGYTLTGEINNTVNVSDSNLSDLKNYIMDNIYNGKAYQLGSVSANTVTYEQTYDGYPLMNNNKARLRFNVSDGEATSYKQTVMSKIEPAKSDSNPKKQVITPRKAIETLYFNRYLKSGDEVLDAKLGYYSVVRETNVQLLQANWEIKVKHKGKNEAKTYYVEATSTNPKVIDN
ncbi:two-component system regulatory protein YycI [Staphylococcus sp. NRL 21/187]|nr:two-component system regulatory protein YycI [Staphylococcus sp. NRL 21/187]MCJ1655186.1 two-component system regulatory protein YycI [Staphylococcus sp. NRL 21/187]